MNDSKRFRYFISYTTNNFGFGNKVLELAKEIEGIEDIYELTDQIQTELNERYRKGELKNFVESLIILNFQQLNTSNH